jgi:hypothetical protein
LDIEAASQVSHLPLCVFGLPPDDLADEGFLSANRIRIRYLRNSPYRIAVKAIHDSLSFLKEGGRPDELMRLEASEASIRAVNRSTEFAEWQRANNAPRSARAGGGSEARGDAS